MLHIVKSWPEFYDAISNGTRFHELRRNDKNYRIGDQMLLQKYDPHTESYLGSQQTVEITSITSAEKPCAVSDEGLHKDFIILSIKKI